MPEKSYFYFGLNAKDPSITRPSFDEYLSIIPTKYRQINPTGSVPSQTSWWFQSDNVDSPIMPEDVDHFLTIILRHEQEIIALMARFPSIKPSLTFVLVVNGKNSTDAPDLSVKAIRFLARINASVEFDIYWDDKY